MKEKLSLKGREELSAEDRALIRELKATRERLIDRRDVADAIIRVKFEIEKILGAETAEAYARELSFAVAEAEWKKQAENELEVS